MEASNQLKIEHVKISKLKAATYNPRTWSEETKKQLTDSISQFGLVDPLLVNGASTAKISLSVDTSAFISRRSWASKKFQ